MKERTQQAVQDWLDAAAAAIGGDKAHRRDVLLELETTIYDRIDERTRGGELPEEAVGDVLAHLGDPGEVGGSFVPAPPLVAPHQTRTYLINTSALFAVHFLLLVGATVAARELALGPLRIRPLEDPRDPLALLVRGVATLLFDAGAMLVFYALLPRVQRLVRFPRIALAVRPDARRCLQSACFLGLVLVVLNGFRDRLFALYVPDADGVVQIPFAGPGIVDNLVLLNAWLGASILRDLLYARFGERRTTLLVDIAAHAVGLFCLLRIAATEQLVDLSRAPEALDASADGIQALLNTGFVMLALVAAAILGARTVRRVFRLLLG